MFDQQCLIVLPGPKSPNFLSSMKKDVYVNFVNINVSFRWEHLIYQIAGHNELIKHVIKNGRIVHST